MNARQDDHEDEDSEDDLNDAEWAEVPVQSRKANDVSVMCNRGGPPVAKATPQPSGTGSKDRSNMDQPSDNAVVDLRMSSSDEDGDDDDSSVGGDEDDFVEVTVQDIKAPAITRVNKVDSIIKSSVPINIPQVVLFECATGRSHQRR